MKYTLVCFLVIVLCGCSTTYPVSTETNARSTAELAGDHVRIEMHDGREIFAKEVRISTDSASWLDASTDKESTVSMDKIDRIVKKDRVLGGFEGFTLCGLAGVGVGWLSISGEAPGYQHEFKGVAMFGYGMIGAGIGLLTGVILGHSYNYEYQIPEEHESRVERVIQKPPTKGDVLYLKNGDIIQGKIISDSVMYITIRGEDGQTHTYSSSEIDRVHKGK